MAPHPLRGCCAPGGTCGFGVATGAALALVYLLSVFVLPATLVDE